MSGSERRCKDQAHQYCEQRNSGPGKHRCSQEKTDVSLRLRGPCKCVEVQVYSLQEAREPHQKEMVLVLLANGLLQMLLEPCELCRVATGSASRAGLRPQPQHKRQPLVESVATGSASRAGLTRV